MGIKQHNGNTKADRLAELKIRSPSIQLIKYGAIGLNAIIFSPLLIAADLGSQNGTNITISDGDRITGDTADPSGNLYGVMTPAGNWICPYISRHLLSLNPLLACCRRYSRGER